jgi:hypothetical protein
MTANAQTEVRAETQLSVSSGSHTPLWLNANKYGLSSLNNTNGYFRAGIFKSLQADSARRWAIGYGADMALAGGYTSTTVVQQAYVDVRWLKGLLTIGSKEQPMQLKSQWLSTGSQTLGINARPVPGIRISLPEYWEVPYTKRWVALKGHVAYGMMTDDNWQKDFTHEKTRHVEHAKLHTKAGYLRIGKEGKPISVEMGLEMACQFGGTTYMDTGNGMMKIENEDGLKSMLRAFIPGGNDANEEIYKNKEGNHLGSYLLRINMDFDKWYLGVYADHYFEDHSQMFFVDYNGYGQGEDYNKWVDKRWFVYDVKDIMMGAELKLKEQKWVNNIVVEYLYTKYQSGAIYHDRTRHISDHIAGRDEYYNHFYHTGWQHWGQVMGNPLYRSPLYNDDGNIRVADNRFWAWHLALSGTPATELSYRLMATWQRGWGTYNYPLPDPERNMSLMAEARYAFGDAHPLAGWELKAAIGIDHGELLGNNIGTQITIGKRLNIDKKK